MIAAVKLPCDLQGGALCLAAGNACQAGDVLWIREQQRETTFFIERPQSTFRPDNRRVNIERLAYALSRVCQCSRVEQPGSSSVSYTEGRGFKSRLCHKRSLDAASTVRLAQLRTVG